MNPPLRLWHWIVICALVLLVLFLLIPPSAYRRRDGSRASRTAALNNVKQIGLALQEFEADYGSFPDARTAQAVREVTGSTLDFSGNSSNACLRQLLAAKNPIAETAFGAKTGYTRVPDGRIDGSHALEAGENGFAYILKAPGVAQKSSDPAERPVLATTTCEGRDDWTFHPKIMGDRAIILRVDFSATALPVREQDGKVSSGVGGRTLEQTGENTVWGSDVKPVLLVPEPLRK